MYKKREYVYADAGKMLKGKGCVGYQFKGEMSDYTEIDCPVEGVAIRGDIAHWGECATLLPQPCTYESLKTKLVKIRYSNDDQLAVMLNGDAEEMARMQAWREWAGEVAKAICRVLGVSC